MLPTNPSERSWISVTPTNTCKPISSTTTNNRLFMRYVSRAKEDHCYAPSQQAAQGNRKRRGDALSPRELHRRPAPEKLRLHGDRDGSALTSGPGKSFARTRLPAAAWCSLDDRGASRFGTWHSECRGVTPACASAPSEAAGAQIAIQGRTLSLIAAPDMPYREKPLIGALSMTQHCRTRR